MSGWRGDGRGQACTANPARLRASSSLQLPSPLSESLCLLVLDDGLSRRTLRQPSQTCTFALAPLARPQDNAGTAESCTC